MSVLLLANLDPPVAPKIDGSSASDAALEKIDARLAELETAVEKRVMLKLLIEGWQGRYAKFVCRAEGDLDPLPRDKGIDASDYLLVIAGLGARLSSLPRPDAPIRGLCDMLNKAGR